MKSLIQFHCYLSAHGESCEVAEAYVKGVLNDITPCLNTVLRRFCVAWEKSDKHYLYTSPAMSFAFQDVPTESLVCAQLDIPFVFYCTSLREAYLRIELLESLLRNLCYRQGVDLDFDYGLLDDNGFVRLG